MTLVCAYSVTFVVSLSENTGLVVSTLFPRQLRQKEIITNQADLYLATLSSKTYVFEDKLTKY